MLIMSDIDKNTFRLHVLLASCKDYTYLNSLSKTKDFQISTLCRQVCTENAEWVDEILSLDAEKVNKNALIDKFIRIVKHL